MAKRVDTSAARARLQSQYSPSNRVPFEEMKAKDTPLWVCGEGHEYAQSAWQRIHNNPACPYCCGRLAIPGETDLATLRPDLAAQWHPTLNGDTAPSQVKPKTNRKAWWVCGEGHEWEAGIASRAMGYGCPVCAGQKTQAGVDDLATLRPDLAAQWHPTLNGDTNPSQVKSQASRRAWWKCAEGHEWEAGIADRSKGRGCPVCSGRKALAGFNDLTTTHPDLAAEWHPHRNGSVQPSMYTIKNSRRVWWICAEGHEWEAGIADRSKGRGCPVCSGRRTLAGFNDLATTHPDIAAEWHPHLNGELLPSACSFGSGQVVWWRCSKFGHEWQGTPNARSSAGHGCPVCSGQRVLLGFNDLGTMYPEVAASWHPTKNGGSLPAAYTPGSGRQVWWLCPRGHEWIASIKDRTQGNGCNECWRRSYSSKAEIEIADFLAAAGLQVIRNTRKIIKGELDIFLPERNLAIEYNGVYWHSEAAGVDQDYHVAKWLACENAGIQLIQIWEDDWNRNSDLIKTLLLHKVGLNKAKSIPARKLQVASSSFAEVAPFYAANHIQGPASGTRHLTLVEGREVKAAMTFLRSGGTGEWVLQRYATSQPVPGGFTRLLAAFERGEEGLVRLTTFSDHAISNGALYRANGFSSDGELPPDYSYLVGNIRKHKFGYRLARFKADPALLYEEGLNERQLAALNGLHRVWDSGKTRWVKRYPTS